MPTPQVKSTLVVLLGIAVGFGGMSACSNLRPAAENNESLERALQVTSPRDPVAFPRAMGRLTNHRVLFVGETHDRYSHHLNQLAVIRALHDEGADFAIGMEFFQRPFQRYLDAYVSGKISEKEMLKKTEYYKRWRFDFRLYRPILDYARQHAIPLVALNAPTELVRAVSREGWSAASEHRQGHGLPDVAVPPDQRYRERLLAVYRMHPKGDGKGFERFVQVQLLWDEYMADTAARYLRQHPQRKLVVLAGSGHMRGGSGIPERLQGRLSLSYAVILSGSQGDFAEGAADLLLQSEFGLLPRGGRLGLKISGHDTGVVIRSVGSSERREFAGVEAGDRIVSIAGERIDSLEDVRLAMLDRRPGERVWLELERSGDIGPATRVRTRLKLI